MPMVLGRRGALEGDQPLDFTVSKFSHLGGLFRLAAPASPPPGLQALRPTCHCATLLLPPTSAQCFFSGTVPWDVFTLYPCDNGHPHFLPRAKSW